ncbi:MAG: sulfatase-like hydrolase/transferase [Planctomycetes bacterium]|nr:sulfatase-like hydrolase/transferase [Planctomycetota bacterium]
MRRALLRLLPLLAPLLAACAAAPAADAPPRRPNLIVLFADDAGYADFGFQPVNEPDVASLTPRIDSIARDGARFSAFYVSGAVCSPSRAGLLTGRWQERFGHGRNLPPGYMEGGLALDETTLADRLRAAGYTTGLVGKWHLGYPDAYHPLERGFDAFYGLLQGSRSYYPIAAPSPHRVLLDGRAPTPEAGYVTDRLGAAAARFVAKHAHDEQPFFLFVSFTAPHGPLQPREADLASPELARIPGERRRKYAGLVKALDDNVGVVLDALERAGIADDTLVVFTNDNGGQTQTGAKNTPLHGRKGTVWEGGVRVPCAVRWPGVVAAGRVIDAPAITLDLAPTFCALAGAPAPPAAALDGVDLTPLLRGAAADLGERTFYWRTDGGAGPVGARRGRWKLVWNDRAAAPALFDLAADVGEAHDLARERPDVVAELRAAVAAWEAQMIEPRWGG